jgi:hypothetical protein
MDGEGLEETEAVGRDLVTVAPAGEPSAPDPGREIPDLPDPSRNRA